MGRAWTVPVAGILALAAGCSADGTGERSGPGLSTSTTTSTGRVLGAVETTTTSPPPSAAATNPGSVYTSGDVTIPPGDPGLLSVVLVGRPRQSSVPVVMRNRTGNTFTSLEVTGTARHRQGALVASGSSHGLVPAVLRPGEWGFGDVYFQGPDLPEDATFNLTMTGRRIEGENRFGAADVTVVEVSRAAGSIGGVIAAIVTNPTDDEVRGPISAVVMCFAEGRPTSTHQGYADGNTVPPGGTVSLSVDLFGDQCGAFALGASGYGF